VSAPTVEASVEIELVVRAQRGEHEAFQDLVREPYHRLYALARRILRDPYLAEDAVQDAIVRAWRDPRGLRDPARFEAWLYRLLVNACRDEARRLRRREIEVSVLPIDRSSGDDGVGLVADRDELERAFLRLSIDQRAALVLSHYAGYSAPEIAALIGVPTGTVYSRLHYGAQAMRAALAPPADAPVAATEQVR
jgi:RNA polymerase sigma-70 factor (ECF subfamily)